MDYIQAGNALTLEERLEAARMLRLGVDPGPTVDVSRLENVWRDEFGSRVDDIFAGHVDLVDAEETNRILAARLAAKRG